MLVVSRISWPCVGFPHIKSRSLLLFENPHRTYRSELKPFTSEIQSWDVVTHVYNSNIQEAEAGR